MADIPLIGIILNEPINARCFMGAFWNPNGGFIVNSKRLSTKEVTVLKRKWSGSPQSQFKPLIGWWKKIKFAVLAIFC
jgi:hypothetical protein